MGNERYARYTVRVRNYEGDKMFEIIDNLFDSHDYAMYGDHSQGSGFSRHGLYSYSENAVAFVERAIGGDRDFFEWAEPGKCYQIITKGVHGYTTSIEEVPANWYHR